MPRPARLQVPLEAQRSDHHEKKVQCQQNQYETLERDSGNGPTLARAELAFVSEDPWLDFAVQCALSFWGGRGEGRHLQAIPFAQGQPPHQRAQKVEALGVPHTQLFGRQHTFPCNHEASVTRGKRAHIYHNSCQLITQLGFDHISRGLAIQEDWNNIPPLSMCRLFFGRRHKNSRPKKLKLKIIFSKTKKSGNFS